jgi:hypothetical protein
MALSIKISNDDPNPNGAAAKLSKSSNGAPNQATWKALDGPYNVGLPSSVWSAPAGSSLSFSLAKGETSAVYTLKSNAPTGKQGYTISSDSGTTGQPEVMVDP